MPKKFTDTERDIADAFQEVEEQRIRFEDHKSIVESAAEHLAETLESYDEAASDYKRAMRSLNAIIRGLAQEARDA